MSVYPKWLYHAEKQPCVVSSEAERLALGEDWAESPADFEKNTSGEASDAVPPPDQDATPDGEEVKKRRRKAKG